MLTSFWGPIAQGLFILWLFGWLPVKPPQWLTGGAAVDPSVNYWPRVMFLLLLTITPPLLLTWIDTAGLRRRSSIRDIPVMLRLVLATRRGRVTFVPMVLSPLGIALFQTSLGAYTKRIGLLLLCEAIMIFLLPPCAIVLASSSPLSDRFFVIARRLMHPFRVVSLLEGKLFGLVISGLGLDNLRTINSANWRAVIHRLIEITPLVIVDARFPTPHVCEEITHLLDERRVSKTIFVVNEDGSAPGIEEAGVNMTDLPLVCCSARDLHIVVTKFRNTLELSAVTSKQQ